MSCSATSAAATSSWVERGLEAQRAIRHRRPAGRGPGNVRGASDPGVVAEVLDPVESLPGELGLAAPEVAVGGGLLVDGTAEIQILDDAGGGQVEVAADHRFQLRGGNLARPVGVH